MRRRPLRWLASGYATSTRVFDTRFRISFMNVLLLGSGGREHALAWKLAASPLLSKLYATPGNPGIAEEAEIVGLKVEEHAAIEAFCKANKIDLVVVGPEAPLVAGLVDRLSAAKIKAVGPIAAAARLGGWEALT